MGSISVEINKATSGLEKINLLAAGPADSASMYRRIAMMLEAETEENFAAQGRPAWVPLSASTKAARLKKNKGSSVLKILQDSGILASSVSTSSGSDYSEIGAGGAASDYAAAQQFGAHIEKPAYSTRTRLRTDAKGNLLRQTAHKNLAVFAKDTHKRVTESWSYVAGHSFDLQARPYLPFSGRPGSVQLQPTAAAKLIAIVTAAIEASL
jgi:phage virion morphogenesis protein